MKQTRKILGVAAAAGMMLAAAPSVLWAESAAQSGNDAEFVAGTGFYDPNAPGTKYSGTVTIAYDKATVTPTGCSTFFITKMYVVLTLQQGNDRRAFTANAQDICFDNQDAQANVVIDLIGDVVIPALYNNCAPGACPGFKVKSFTNFQYTSGANSADITIAVQ